MITSVEVFKKIKTISARTLNPRQRILLHDILSEMFITQNSLVVLLIELENRGLVKIHHTTVVSVSLTNYGITQEDPLGGLNSEG